MTPMLREKSSGSAGGVLGAVYSYTPADLGLLGLDRHRPSHTSHTWTPGLSLLPGIWAGLGLTWEPPTTSRPSYYTWSLRPP